MHLSLQYVPARSAPPAEIIASLPLKAGLIMGMLAVLPSSPTPIPKPPTSLLSGSPRKTLTARKSTSRSNPISYTQVTASGLSTWRRQPKTASISGHPTSKKRLGMGMQGTPARKKAVRSGSKSIGRQSTPRKFSQHVRFAENASSSSIPISDLPDPDEVQLSSSVQSPVETPIPSPDAMPILPISQGDVFVVRQMDRIDNLPVYSGSKKMPSSSGEEDASLPTVRATYKEIEVPLNDLVDMRSSSNSGSRSPVHQLLWQRQPTRSSLGAPFRPSQGQAPPPTPTKDATTLYWSLEEALNDQTRHPSSPITSVAARRSRSIQARLPTPFKIRPSSGALRHKPVEQGVTSNEHAQLSTSFSTPRPPKPLAPLIANHSGRDDISPPASETDPFKADVFQADEDKYSTDWYPWKQEALMTPDKSSPCAPLHPETRQAGAFDDDDDLEIATDGNPHHEVLDAVMHLQRDQISGPSSQAKSSSLICGTEESYFGFRWARDHLSRRETELEPPSSQASPPPAVRAASPMCFPVSSLSNFCHSTEHNELMPMPELQIKIPRQPGRRRGVGRGARRKQTGTGCDKGLVTGSENDCGAIGRESAEVKHGRHYVWYETELTQEQQVARQRRCAHYMDLKENYQLHMEYVLD